VHIAVIGAGALGLVYGVRLALRTKSTVTFVVRPKRVDSTDPFVIESAWNDARETLDEPRRAAVVPADADVILLAVGTEDLEALPLGDSTAPIVILTPMMPQDWKRVRAAYGERALSAMPTMSSYVRKSDGVVRYWLLPAPTLIDEPRPAQPVIEALVEELRVAGLKAKLELGVHESNPATTVGFIAIGMGLAIAGSAAALAADEELCGLVSRACTEGGRLAHRIGRPEPLALAFPFLTSKWALRLWLRALPAEARFFAEDHFGRKIADQHRVMIRQMIELAAEKALPHSAFDEIERRLVSSTHGTP
jgi:2-dehydropantoate 2-reductase